MKALHLSFFSEQKFPCSHLFPFMGAMSFVVILSNILVQFPVHGFFHGVPLHDFLTWGAFTYPFSFLVTDLANRRYGAYASRLIALAGFFCAIIFSVIMPWLLFEGDLGEFFLFPARFVRIGIASGLSFLFAQFIDISVFNYLRARSWWCAPLYGTLAGSLCDTALFFSISFSSVFSFFGPNDPFSFMPVEVFMRITGFEITRWVSWAMADFCVKLLVAFFALIPYRVFLSLSFQKSKMAA